jgi:hypothetical protein
MNTVSAKVWIVLLALALVLPSIGPLMDHHFAELQPDHRHLGPPRHHTHAYSHQHGHSQSTSGETVDAAGAGAVYNHDSGPPAVVVVTGSDMAIQSFLRYEPTSEFTWPPPSFAQANQTFTAPPEKPPQQAL